MKKSEELLKLLQMTTLFSREKLKIDDVNSVFESLLFLILDNYKKGVPTYIPYIGKIKVEFEDQKYVKGGIRAKLKIEVEADEFIEHEIMVLEKDNKTTEDLYLNKIIRDKDKNLFSTKMES